MGKYASEVVKLAKKWIGKKESDGSHKSIIDIYNSHKPLARGYKVKYTDAWCATTVSAIAIKLGYTDIIPTECSCIKMIELFMKKKIWVEDDAYKPKPGDIIFYDWQDDGKGDNKGSSDHVGIVEKVSGKTITVIEGNYGDSVKRRTITVGGKTIRGYGVPKYDEPKKETTKKDEKTEKKTGKSIYYKKYTGKSEKIDEVLKSIDVPSKYIGNWVKRKPIAIANGIRFYYGSRNNNLTLVSLAKKGKLKKA